MHSHIFLTVFNSFLPYKLSYLSMVKNIWPRSKNIKNVQISFEVVDELGTNDLLKLFVIRVKQRPQSWKGCLYHKCIIFWNQKLTRSFSCNLSRSPSFNPTQCIMWNQKLTRSFSCNLRGSLSFNPKFLINVQSYCKWSS